MVTTTKAAVLVVGDGGGGDSGGLVWNVSVPVGKCVHAVWEQISLIVEYV